MYINIYIYIQEKKQEAKKKSNGHCRKNELFH